MTHEELLDSQIPLLELLEGMIAQQKGKCLVIARRLNPRITEEDILNPFDWPEINENPQFIWEDGLLAGLISAHTAIAAQLNDTTRGAQPQSE